MFKRFDKHFDKTFDEKFGKNFVGKFRKTLERQSTANRTAVELLAAVMCVSAWLATEAIAQNSNSSTPQSIRSQSIRFGADSTSTTKQSFSGTTYAPPQRFSSNDPATPESTYSSASTTVTPVVTPAPAVSATPPKPKSSFSSLVNSTKKEGQHSGFANSGGSQFSNGYSAGSQFQGGYSAGTQFSSGSSNGFSNGSSSGSTAGHPSKASQNYEKMPDGTYRAHAPAYN